MKRYFCTYFNDAYLIYGLTMFRTLKATGIDFRLFVLCLDDPVYEKLTGFAPEIEPVRLSELESADPETAACRGNRSLIEYFFTLSPALPLFLFRRDPEIDILAYVDSDFMFFSSPEPIWEELGGRDVLIYEHDFLRRRDEDLHGRFNVGFQLYRNSEEGLRVLRWWRERCIEWCYDRHEPDRFADQKYLDRWPVLFPSAVAVAEKTRPQALAPWNMKKHVYSLDGGRVYSDGKPVIFFHFQGCKMLSPRLLFAQLWDDQTIPLLFDCLFYFRCWKALSESRKIIASPENMLGGRAPISHEMFNRSRRFKKMPAFLCFAGHVVLGIWRYHNIRPFGLRLFRPWKRRE